MGTKAATKNRYLRSSPIDPWQVRVLAPQQVKQLAKRSDIVYQTRFHYPHDQETW